MSRRNNYFWSRPFTGRKTKVVAAVLALSLVWGGGFSAWRAFAGNEADKSLGQAGGVPYQSNGRNEGDASSRKVKGVAADKVTKISLPNSKFAPCGIAKDGEGLILTDSYGKNIWRFSGGAFTPYAGGGSAADPYGEPMGGYNDAVLTQSLFRLPWAASPFMDGWAVSDPDNDSVRLIHSVGTETLNGRSDKLKMGDTGVVFAHPTGLATDNEGNLYVADTHNGAVRKMTKVGEVSTFAEGLSEPMGLCWQGGVLYIAESGGNRILRAVNGTVETVAGTGVEGFLDGNASEAMFSSPEGVAVAEDGTVYVADTVNGAVRRVRNGAVDTLICPDEAHPYTWPIAPTGLCLSAGGLYVTDPFARVLLFIPLG